MWSNYSEASKSAAREMLTGNHPTSHTRTVNIDTRFRENYYKTESTNFHVSLPIRIKGVIKMTLCSLELPMTINNISASQGNNFLYIDGTKYTIPDGNYTASLIQTELSNRLNAAGFTAIVDERTMRVVISKLGGGTFVLKFTDSTVTNLQYSLGWMLGFRFANYEGNESYVSEAPYIIKSPRYLFLCVDDFNNNATNSIVSAFNSSISTNNILAKISLAEQLNDNIFIMTLEDRIVSGCKERNYSGPVDIEKLRIQLIDEYGRIVNLNGSDFSFSLDFMCV